MGEFASTVQADIRDGLADRHSRFAWETEFDVAGTPVDVAGRADDRLVLVELEWRRADPVGNTAKLFRHLDSGALDAGQVTVVQVFSGYYDLARGGVSSKRLDAEFVGRVAADALDALSYDSLDLDVDPPKRGGDPPPDWEAAVGDVVATISERVGA
ncbi:MAG: hypothetical protein V5A30_10700 [Haloarculaceae archaeon]